MGRTYLVHYSEIGLKGRNRPDFEQQLEDNIRVQHPVRGVRRLHGRILVEADAQLDLGNVFGIAWWTEIRPVSTDLEEIRLEVLRAVAERGSDVETFAVRVNRADKVLDLRSVDIEAQLGRRVLDRFPLRVDLHRPDLTVLVEITRDVSFVFTEKRRGLMGLPFGSSGRLMGLFSAGIDSAVAAYLMARRGAEVELIHFYAVRTASSADEGTAGKVARILAGYFPQLRVHYVPYHRFQLATMAIPRRLQRQEVVVFRRFMARVAQELARRRRAQGLFLGDSLGQVASQTLSNMAAMDEVLQLPVFRPLISHDKGEITEIGAMIGIEEATREPLKDCCSIIARRPSTVARREQIAEVEEILAVDQLVERTLEEVESVLLEPRSRARLFRTVS